MVYRFRPPLYFANAPLFLDKVERLVIQAPTSVRRFALDARAMVDGGELGVAYTGDPNVSLTRSGPPSAFLDAALNYEEQRVKDYAEKFKWWPVVKLAVTY